MERSYTFLNHSQIFRSKVDNASTGVVARKIFGVGPTKMNLFAEIFYEPYLMDDLEIAIFSKDVERIRTGT
jgi:hypothetical protein